MRKPTRKGPDVHLNLNVRGLQPSATLAINERSDALRARGRTIFKLGLGQSPFPVPESVVRALQRHAHEKDYLPVAGHPDLRAAVAEAYGKELDLPAGPGDVLVGPGSKELMFLLQLVYYGDILIPTPSWVSYAPQATIIGRHIRWIQTDAAQDWKLTPDQLDAVCRPDPRKPRILILNYPSNPTGISYAPDELKRLARVARRYRVIVLSDEIYSKLHHDQDHHSIIPLYPEGSIFSSGLSKWCGAGGWRLGVFVFPENLHWLGRAMAVVASETFTSTSAPIQLAAVEAFRGGPAIDAYVAASARILKGLGRHLTARLREAGVAVHQPDGGFYLFPDFSAHEPLRARGITTSRQLCEQLLEDTGVAVLPGEDFGRDPHELTARLAYVNFDGKAALRAALAGAAVDRDFLGTYCADTLEAVDRLCDWANA